MIICIKTKNSKVKSINTKDIKNNIVNKSKDVLTVCKAICKGTSMLAGVGINKVIEWSFKEREDYDRIINKESK